jgi:hypothetical protein
MLFATPVAAQTSANVIARPMAIAYMVGGICTE